MAISSLSTSSMVSGVKRRKIWDQSATTDGFFQIATTNLNTTASEIVFSSIPSTYTHLQIRLSGLTSFSDRTMFMQFNSDTGSNYSAHQLYGTGSIAVASSNVSTTAIIFTYSAQSTSGLYPFVSVIDILDYKDTNKFKTVTSIGGNDMNGATGYATFMSGNWRSTSAISSIKIYPNTNSFNQYSSFALYGIKG